MATRRTSIWESVRSAIANSARCSRQLKAIGTLSGDTDGCCDDSVGDDGEASDKRSGLLREPKRLHRGNLRIAEEYRIDVFDDVRANLQKRALVLDGNQRSLGAIVHRNPERLCE